MYISPIHALAAHDEITVDSPSALQEALNSDAAIIRISPQNEELDLYLDKSLTISNNRTVTLIADNPTRIIGASNQWQIITNQDTDVTIRFINVTLDGNNNSMGIYNKGTLTLENAVIQNCYNNNNGAGIYSTGSLNISNSIFSNNVANAGTLGDGGAICAKGSTSRIAVDIFNSTFTNNKSRYGGGVRFDNADVHVTNCELNDNTSIQGSSIYIASSVLDVTGCVMTGNNGSGAIFVNISTLFLTDSTIVDNNCRAIYVYGVYGDADITVNGNTLISGNVAKTSYGGGIIGYTWDTSMTTINIIDNAVISHNEALHGGGVSSYPDSNVVINISGNAQIINNTAYENGGGIYGNGTVNMHGGKISSNTAKNGGGIYADADTSVNITDALINNNTAEQDGGGIWINDLNNLTANHLLFQNNKALAGHFWRVNTPVDESHLEDATTHKDSILNTSYTTPYTNAYNNYDINYTPEFFVTPFTVTYHANNSDSGEAPNDQNNPYLTGESVTILPPLKSFAKSGYTFTGWNTKPDGTGKYYSYDKGKIYPKALTMGDENVILYAQWKQIVAEPSTSEKPNPQSPEITDPDFTPDSSPGYQHAPADDNTTTLQNPDGTTVGRWENTDNGWTYQPTPDTIQPVPLENGSFEITDQDDNALGLWSKNENDDETYEEYPTNRWQILWFCIPVLLGLGAAIYCLIFLRQRVTREGFVRMVTRAIHLKTEIENNPPFSDISEDAQYYDAIMSAQTAGLLTGFPDSEFQPFAFITREEISSILAAALRYIDVPLPSDHIDLCNVFWDFDEMSESFIEDIQLTVQLEIMEGRTDDQFEPKGLSTKGQASKIIKNLLVVVSPYLPSDPESS